MLCKSVCSLQADYMPNIAKTKENKKPGISQCLKLWSSSLLFYQNFTKKFCDLLVFTIISSSVTSGILLRIFQDKKLNKNKKQNAKQAAHPKVHHIKSQRANCKIAALSVHKGTKNFFKLNKKAEYVHVTQSLHFLQT